MNDDWEDVEVARQSSDSGGDPDIEREWTVRQLTFRQAGYREGLDEGKALTVQSGFDEGFVRSAAMGREAGRKRGLAQTMQTAGSLPKPIESPVTMSPAGNPKSAIIIPKR